MKTKIIIILAITIATSIGIGYSTMGKKCTGSKNCNACRNCKYCKYCAKNGGTCGVCK